VDLVGGGGGASFQAAEAAPVARQVAPAPVVRQQAAPAPAVSADPAPDQIASQMLSKYGLSSPRDNVVPAAAPVRSTSPANGPPVRIASPREHVPAARVASPREHVAAARVVSPREAAPPARTVVESPRQATGNLRGGIEAEVRAEINQLRTNPASFVAHLEKRKQVFWMKFVYLF
jgi:hypothetical protein